MTKIYKISYIELMAQLYEINEKLSENQKKKLSSAYIKGKHLF